MVKHKYYLKVTLKGIGYKILKVNDQVIAFYLGYSHPVFCKLSKHIFFSISKTNQILFLSGYQKESLLGLQGKLNIFKPKTRKNAGIFFYKQLFLKT